MSGLVKNEWRFDPIHDDEGTLNRWRLVDPGGDDWATLLESGDHPGKWFLLTDSDDRVYFDSLEQAKSAAENMPCPEDFYFDDACWWCDLPESPGLHVNEDGSQAGIVEITLGGWPRFANSQDRIKPGKWYGPIPTE